MSKLNKRCVSVLGDLLSALVERVEYRVGPTRGIKPCRIGFCSDPDPIPISGLKSGSFFTPVSQPDYSSDPQKEASIVRC